MKSRIRLLRVECLEVEIEFDWYRVVPCDFTDVSCVRSFAPITTLGKKAKLFISNPPSFTKLTEITLFRIGALFCEK